MKRSFKSYFSLVELVLVFAVLAIFASLLQPSLGKMLKQSEKLVCLNNLRQISSLANLYQDDNNGAFYQIWHQNPWNLGWHAWGWIMADTGYIDLKNQSDILFCPNSDQNDRQSWWPKYFTYGVNQLAHYKGVPSDIRKVIQNSDGSSSDYVYLNKAERPSEYMFMLDTKVSSSRSLGKAMITNFDARWNARVWQIHDPGVGATVLYGDGQARFEQPEAFHQNFGPNLNFAYSETESW